MIKLSPMGKADKKLVIGIIGGMCSGKSTVAAEFARMGCAVIDADEIAHQFLDDKDVRAKIVRVFGREILDDKGKISRAELAKRVFGDRGRRMEDRRQKAEDRRQNTKEKMNLLIRVLHPLVLAEVERLIDRYNNQTAVKAIVLDMPLLVEVGWEKRCDRIIFVDCKAPIRLKRAQKTGFFDADELKVRENLQISLDKKKRIADNTVDNNSDLSGLSKQIACLFSSIMDDLSWRRQEP